MVHTETSTETVGTILVGFTYILHNLLTFCMILGRVLNAVVKHTSFYLKLIWDLMCVFFFSFFFGLKTRT